MSDINHKDCMKRVVKGGGGGGGEGVKIPFHGK